MTKTIKGAWGQCSNCKLTLPLVACSFCPTPTCERCFPPHFQFHRQQAELANMTIKAMTKKTGMPA